MTWKQKARLNIYPLCQHVCSKQIKFHVSGSMKNINGIGVNWDVKNQWDTGLVGFFHVNSNKAFFKQNMP